MLKTKIQDKDHIFYGLHCRDCVQWEEDPIGGGRCLAKGQFRWPGSKICDKFTQ